MRHTTNGRLIAVFFCRRQHDVGQQCIVCCCYNRDNGLELYLDLRKKDAACMVVFRVFVLLVSY